MNRRFDAVFHIMTALCIEELVETRLFDQESVEDTLGSLERRGQFIEGRGVAAWPDGSKGRFYEFQHAAFRRILYDRISPAHRQRLHHSIGERIEAVHEQIKFGKGYDHNWVINQSEPGKLTLAAHVSEPTSGRGLEWDDDLVAGLAERSAWLEVYLQLDSLRDRAERILDGIAVDAPDSSGARAIAMESVPGAGSAPGVTVASFGLAVPGDHLEALRRHDPPVIARTRDDLTLLDLRSVDADDDAADLLGAAALVWIAAEHSSTVQSLADETELDPAQVADTLNALLVGEWVVQHRPADLGHR